MPDLSNDNLFAVAGPAPWRSLLELLGALDRLTTDTADFAARRREASELRVHLLREAADLAEELPSTLRPGSPEYRRWFTEALLLWPHFADAAGKALLNTMAETAIVDFPVDFAASDNDQLVLRRAIARLFDWSAEEIDALESRLAQLTANLRIKKAITAAVVEFMGAGRGDWPARGLALMQALYGPAPWRAGDVDVVVTTAAIFLCLPYQGAALTGSDWESRPSDERAIISRFLDQANADQQSLQKVRFPAFGAFDPDAVAAEFVDAMLDRVRQTAGLGDVSRETVAATLSTMVNLLATADVDKYLIHDAAGHGWQETLCEFEWTFRQLPRISDPIAADLIEAFENQGGQTALRSERLVEIIESDLRRRIVIGLNVVMSESLADLVEHKLLREGHPLPSSSLLPEASLKLDLTLADARRMIRGWRAPYRKLIREPAERERLCRQLLSGGLPPDGLAAAVDEAAQLIEQRFGIAFETSMDVAAVAVVAGDAHGQLRVNLLQRIMISMVTFDCAVTRFLKAADAHLAERPGLSRWRTPGACLDLLVLLLGWIYEQERAVHIWHMDELLNERLAATLHDLEDAIDGEIPAVRTEKGRGLST